MDTFYFYITMKLIFHKLQSLIKLIKRSLLFVSQLNKQKTVQPLMLDTFINSALIIDDTVEDILTLSELLEARDIWVKHYTPSDLERLKAPLKNRKLIFMDLQLNPAVDLINN